MEQAKAIDTTSWPCLFKKTSTGSIQFWQIWVAHSSTTLHGWTIFTKYGQVGTTSPQVTSDDIREGKNQGKKNATSAEEQAIAEASAKWEKQKKKGYVESAADAEAGLVDAIIEGGIVPMLAHKFSEQGHKITYPCWSQPKLDGIRCIAVVEDGKATLWSRTRKQITSMPHIIQDIENLAIGQSFILDGELYNHDLKTNFEKIVSMVRQEEPPEGKEIVQYHIYDFPSIDGSFTDRLDALDNLITEKLLSFTEPNSLRSVLTVQVVSEEHGIELFQQARTRGYEGIMLRNAAGLYANKRSYDLQKVKEFDDGEFEIIGIDEGRGKLSGHVGAFKCRMPNGKEFLAKMSGDTDKLRDYFLDHSLWTGKKLTVKYQGLTGKEGVPRFPVGVALRDYE